MSERGGAVWSGEPSCPPEIRSTATLRKVVSLSLSLSLALFLFCTIYICDLHSQGLQSRVRPPEDNLAAGIGRFAGPAQHRSEPPWLPACVLKCAPPRTAHRWLAYAAIRGGSLRTRLNASAFRCLQRRATQMHMTCDARRAPEQTVLLIRYGQLPSLKQELATKITCGLTCVRLALYNIFLLWSEQQPARHVAVLTSLLLPSTRNSSNSSCNRGSPFCCVKGWIWISRAGSDDSENAVTRQTCQDAIHLLHRLRLIDLTQYHLGPETLHRVRNFGQSFQERAICNADFLSSSQLLASLRQAHKCCKFIRIIPAVGSAYLVKVRAGKPTSCKVDLRGISLRIGEKGTSGG